MGRLPRPRRREGLLTARKGSFRRFIVLSLPLTGAQAGCPACQRAAVSVIEGEPPPGMIAGPRVAGRPFAPHWREHPKSRSGEQLLLLPRTPPSSPTPSPASPYTPTPHTMSTEKVARPESWKEHREHLENASIDSAGIEGAIKPPSRMFTQAEEDKLYRKLDWHLMPILTLLYLLSFMDRGNIGKRAGLSPGCEPPLGCSGG